MGLRRPNSRSTGASQEPSHSLNRGYATYWLLDFGQDLCLIFHLKNGDSRSVKVTVSFQ